ncbi:RNA polymerase sigma-70 factor [Chitinophaga barathri]|uniref:RNA polymerase sigma-70 factor n=1 Tax=Chitinophaga barathri TaxID=1647451 RepID=A0A3N4MKK5_9BACT|nr:RNA polymerase sigma-70 factor [Chitinophaga barathri]RPD42596.1 RNA polymerase sigma-70 factor [Chitinophaga barathri]
MKHLQQYDDSELFRLVRDEDSSAAFEALYNRYWEKLLLHAKHKTGSEEDAEEIVQHVFMNIWKTRKNIHLRHSFYTYIASCAKYEILAMLVKQKKQKEAHNSFYDDVAARQDNYTAEWVDYESTRRQLEDTIRHLPDKCRLVFRMSRESGFSEKQIAEKLSISPKTVQAHMTRALKLLRTIMQHRLFFFLKVLLLIQQ